MCRRERGGWREEREKEGGEGRERGKEGGEGGRGRREGKEGGEGGRGRWEVVGWSYQLKQHGLYVPPMEWGASKDSSRGPLGTRSHASFRLILTCEGGGGALEVLLENREQVSLGTSYVCTVCSVRVCVCVRARVQTAQCIYTCIASRLQCNGYTNL